LGHRSSIFYNFESYFGSSQVEKINEEKETSSGPVTGVDFDYKKWQWLLMVEKLVKELNMTPTQVYEMNYIACLNWLSMFSLKEKHIRDIEKKRRR
jgi:hypothetical protein